MKKRNLFTGFAVATMFLIIATGCKKDNNSGSGAAGIGAAINGKAWQSQTTVGIHTDSFIDIFGYYVSGGDTTAFQLAISDTSHIGQADPLISNSIDYYTKTKDYSGDDFTEGHGT